MSRTLTALATVTLLVALSPAAAACISPYGFEDFDPAPLVAHGTPADMAPVDVSSSTADDMFPRLVQYEDALIALWMKSTGVTVVSENLVARELRDGAWGPLMVVNNPDPAAGTLEGLYVRIAGFDAAVHDGLLYVVWCTSDPALSDGTDDDPVYRTYDGASWGPIVSLVPPSDGGEDVQPAIASTDAGLLVAWTTSSPVLSDGRDQDIVARYLGPGASDSIFELTPKGDSEHDFMPRMVSTPGGAHIVWHTRTLRMVPGSGEQQYVLEVRGRRVVADRLYDVVNLSGATEGEDIWTDMLWSVDRVHLVWQRRPASGNIDRSSIIHREWELHALGPAQEVSAGLGKATNGHPSIAIIDGELTVLWHTDDDAIKPGTLFAIVKRASQGGGHWGPVEVFRSESASALMDVDTVGYRDGTYAAWIINVTRDLGPPQGASRDWDVVVGPVDAPTDLGSEVTVTPRWVRSTEAWGPADRLVFEVSQKGAPMGGAPLQVTVKDPRGDVEAVLAGTTDAQGRASFGHVLRASGEYSLAVSVNGSEMGALSLRVSAPPPGNLDNLAVALLAVVAFVALFALAGLRLIASRGTVDPRRETFGEALAGGRGRVWGAASRALTYVVRSARAQGILQIPLFVLFVLSIVLGFLGTQDPKANFTTMLGWVYYLPGMLILYAFFGRLWCYVEACGFVDTWAKRLLKGRAWREWPDWLQNLWPAFILLLAGFWVEIVLSIDLYPWAVATFMLAIMLLNVVISTHFGKRTYCRFLCRDGVVEELIARYSLFRIGVRARETESRRGGACIWKEEEKRPGYCSMCFTCLQSNPDVKEATVTPMLLDYGEDVYRPKAVHRDEAWAALLLMGISIPYMAVLSRAWWVGLSDVAAAWAPASPTVALLALGAALCAATAVVDVLAVRRWPGALTPSRRAVLVLLECILLAHVFVALLGGTPGRIALLRTLVVLGAVLLPFIVVWLGERLVVALTGDARREGAGRLMERYGLIFIPVFVGVLIARNLPITGTWGWAVFDIIKATFTDFPGGAADVVPRPFVDPSLHFALGVAALAIGFALGAYAALQISRRLYAEPRHASRAFTVQCALLGFMVLLLVGLLALPPF